MEIKFEKMPISETWSSTGRVVWCKFRSGDPGWLGVQMQRLETGEIKYEPLPFVVVDERGRPVNP